MSSLRTLAIALLLAGLAPLSEAGDQGRKSRFVEKLDRGEKQTIVVYGTSLTATGQWRRQFAAVMNSKYGARAVVRSGAQSGSDSIWGLANIEERVFVHSPDVLFIEFSMNDAITKRGTTIAAARKNLEDMIDRTLKRFPNCEIILMSMNPSLRSGRSLIRPKLAEYYDSYQEVAEKRGLQFIDNEQAWNDFLGERRWSGTRYIPDRIHPNGLGAKEVITPNVLKSVGVEFEADDIPLYEDPPSKKKPRKKPVPARKSP